VTSFVENEPKIRSKSKGNKVKGQSGAPNGRVLEMFNDYRQNRFCKNSKASGGSRGSGSPVSSGASTSIFSKYSKKSSQSVPTGKNHEVQHNDKESSLKMFSLPPIFVSQGIDMTNHRICDLPSGLY